MERSSNSVRNVVDTIRQLRETGLRVTEPRKEVVHAIHAQSGMFSGDGLYDRLKSNGSRVGRATVFRTIDVLVELGILDRVHQPDGSHGYVLRGPGHRHHLVCSACGTVIEFQGCNIGELVDDLADRTSFQIEGHWLEIFGTCASCQRVAGS